MAKFIIFFYLHNFDSCGSGHRHCVRQTDTEKSFDVMMAGVIVLFQSFGDRESLRVWSPVEQALQRYASKQKWERCYTII